MSRNRSRRRLAALRPPPSPRAVSSRPPPALGALTATSVSLDGRPAYEQVVVTFSRRHPVRARSARWTRSTPRRRRPRRGAGQRPRASPRPPRLGDPRGRARPAGAAPGQHPGAAGRPARALQVRLVRGGRHAPAPGDPPLARHHLLRRAHPRRRLPAPDALERARAGPRSRGLELEPLFEHGLVLSLRGRTPAATTIVERPVTATAGVFLPDFSGYAIAGPLERAPHVRDRGPARQPARARDARGLVDLRQGRLAGVPGADPGDRHGPSAATPGRAWRTRRARSRRPAPAPRRRRAAPASRPSRP